MAEKNNNNIVVFSTRASLYFAKAIAKKLGLKVTKTFRKTFGGGEKYYRLGIDDRLELIGKTVIVVGSTHTDSAFLELHRIGCASAGYGAVRRIFLIPFMGNSTMERAVLPGEVVTAKTNNRILSGIPNTGLGNAFFHFDLHMSGLLHYYEEDCLRYEIYGGELLVKALKGMNISNFMFASADLGRPRWVQYFADKFGVTDLAFVHTTRNFEDKKVDRITGSVSGKNVIIYDDMSRSFGTLIKAAEVYLGNGALSVAAVLSHLALNNKKVIEQIIASPLQWVMHTNSHPMSRHRLVRASNKFIPVDITGEYIKAITPLLPR